jgi:hypothetical protein
LSRRLIAATLVAMAALAIVTPTTFAECSPGPDTATERLDVGYAFVATITESSRDVDPPVVDNSAFNWHVELVVDRTYYGKLPATIVYNGWDAGCHELRADQLKTGDRVFMLAEGFHSEYLPRDPFGGDVSLWRSTGNGWQFDPDVLMYGWDPMVYTRQVQDASTTSAILRVVASVTQPETDTARPGITASAHPEPLPIAVFLAGFLLMLAYMARRDDEVRESRDIGPR